MIEARSTFSTGTGQAWTLLPMSIRLVVAIVAVIGIGYLVAAAIDTPTTVPAVVNAAVVPAPMRDPSVPQASQVIRADERQHEESISTF